MQTRSRSSQSVIVGLAAATLALALGGCGDPAESPSGTASQSSSPIDPRIDRRADLKAQTELAYALAAAQSYLARTNNFDGLDEQAATDIEPRVRWAAAGKAEPSIVHIDLARDFDVVMSERSDSGAVFCIADGNTGPVTGTRDGFGATSAADCGTTQAWDYLARFAG